jgi:hypothetical protein
MSTIAVQVHRRDERLDLEADLQTARFVARLLDAQFSVFGFKFGLDPLVGLIPVVGDTIMLIASLYPIHIAQKHGLGKSVIRRMKLNIAIDYFIGLTPIVGDFFDAMFKANLKNVALLEKAVAERGSFH